MRRPGITPAFWFAALVAFAACGGEAGLTEPKTDNPVDTTPKVVDTAAANAAARTARTNELLSQINDALTAMDQSASAGGVGGPGSAASGAGASTSRTVTSSAPPPPPPDAAKCNFDEATVRWNCPDIVQANGITVKSWHQFLDADGVPHKLIDTARTVAIRRFIGKSGITASQLTLQDGTVKQTQNTTNNTDTLVLAGLKGPPADRRLNGKGSMDVRIVAEGGPNGTTKASTTTENFSFTPPPPPGAPAGAPHFPLTGKITAIVQSARDDAPQSGSTTTQVTEYDGTKIAKLTITSANGTVLRVCTYDMTSPSTPAQCTVPGH